MPQQPLTDTRLRYSARARALSLLLLAMSLPQQAAAMCVFEENPVSLEVTVTKCTSNGLEVLVHKGLEKGAPEETDPTRRHELRFREGHSRSCDEFELQERRTIEVLLHCCDVQGQACFLGWVEERSKAEKSPFQVKEHNLFEGGL